ncbi:MAG: UDP-2,3-diacylglucosamine diphosphatase [Oligoflexia bacterium]|nr:UDP-2,3-diacylglucosamine diphosphatase [Oligoflexia bacterium]
MNIEGKSFRKIAFISDLHVKNSKDIGYSILLDFLSHPLVNECTDIYLLGDIFNLMIGNHRDYFVRYREYFNLLKHLLNSQICVNIFEGNHDFHLSDLYKIFVANEKLERVKLRVHKSSFQEMIYGRSFYFSHGDELFARFAPLDNGMYFLYRAFIRSLVANFIIGRAPLAAVDFIGERAARFSSGRRCKNCLDFSAIRKKFRGKIMDLAIENDHDFLICGHVHIQDDFIFTDDTGKSRHYINNGYPLENRTFGYIDSDSDYGSDGGSDDGKLVKFILF